MGLVTPLNPEVMRGGNQNLPLIIKSPSDSVVVFTLSQAAVIKTILHISDEIYEYFTGTEDISKKYQGY